MCSKLFLTGKRGNCCETLLHLFLELLILVLFGEELSFEVLGQGRKLLIANLFLLCSVSDLVTKHLDSLLKLVPNKFQ